jgi:hypothetical protein
MALLLEQETYKIIGAYINVHKALGCGFLELTVNFGESSLKWKRFINTPPKSV